MNESINERLKDTFSTVDFNTYRPAAVYGDMSMESGFLQPPTLKADYASSESSRSSSELFKIIEEIIEKTLPRYDAGTYQEFVDFRPKPKPKRRKQEIKQPEEELSVGDTSSLDAFMGEFTVSKRVGEV